MASNWKSPAAVPRAALPAGLRRLLLERGSFTRRLERALRGPVEVTVNREGWEPAMAEEARLLRLPRQARVYVREVTLGREGRRCVYARTVIPRATFKAHRRALAGLGNRPLGEVLFALPGVSRARFEVACLSPRTRLYRKASPGARRLAAQLWARRSLFRLEGQPLIVYEVFLGGVWR